MTKSKNLGLNLPYRDNTTDLADINVISDNFETIDNEFEKVYNKLNNSGVINTVSGNPIVLKDSASAPLQNLKLFGKTEQNGTPTPDAPIPLVSVGDSGSFEVGVYGKSLLEIPKEAGFTTSVYGVVYTVNDDKSISVSGTPTDNTNWKNITFSGYKFSLPKGTYKFACAGLKTPTKLHPILYYTDLNGKAQTIVSYYGRGLASIPFTITDENKDNIYLLIACAPDYTPQGERLYMSIFPESVTDLSYEPYTKQTLTMPYTLTGLGNTKDEVDFAKGVITRKCVKFNNFVFVKYNENNTFRAYMSNITVGNTGVCNLYSRWNTTVASMPDNTFRNTGDGNIYVRDTRFSTVEEINNAYANGKLELIAVLQTPIETPLTETELNAYRQLHTNKPTTTFISEADMEASYMADTKLYIDNKIAELTALTLEV